MASKRTTQDVEDDIDILVAIDERTRDEQEAQTENARMQQKILSIAGVIAFYFVVSISLVFLNKFVLSHAKYKIDAPLFVTWLQLVMALVFVIILGYINVPGGIKIPRFEFNLQTAVKVIPVTILYVGMLATNNLCLTYVNMAFFQVARSLTIVFNIVLTIVVLRGSVSVRTIFACVIVISGFVTASRGELKFSWVGTAFGVTASCFNALYSIYVKKVLPMVDGNEWRLMGYNTTLAIILLLPVTAAFGEFSVVAASKYLGEPKLWALIGATGVAGFLINVAVFLQIKHTSPLTNNISGTAKAALQTIVAVMFLGDEITMLNVMGIVLVIIGSAYYSHIKLSEMRQSSK